MQSFLYARNNQYPISISRPVIVRDNSSLYSSPSRSGTAAAQSDASGEATGRAQTPVLCLTKYSKGFLCSAGNGVVFMYEKTDERELYKKAREIRIPVSNDSAQTTANMKV